MADKFYFKKKILNHVLTLQYKSTLENGIAVRNMTYF